MANELSALLEVAGDAVDRLAITPAQSLHRAVARRVFASVGPFGAPTRVVHDGISTVAYSAVRIAVSATTTAAAAAVRAAAGGELRPLSASSRGRHTVSAINALVGDVLEERGSDLAIEMSLRKAARDIPVTRAALRRAFPQATGRVAVFLHGLAENEEWWLRGSARRRGVESRSFGARLRADLGITPIDIRYNTGLHVSENGRMLDDLLEQLTLHWPVEVADLALVGHSMGGLVARSAYHAARRAQPRRTWHRRLGNVVTLGSPHTGAPVEKALHAAAWALRRVPEAAPLGEVLDIRSAGIRDLRHGYLLADEWSTEDPARLIDDRRIAVPLLKGCTHTFITATITRDPKHPLGWIAGDLLVRSDSAAGRHRKTSIPVPVESVVHLGPLTHFDLLDHPVVYTHVRAALATRPRKPARAGVRAT